MDLNPDSKAIDSAQEAQLLADRWADAQTHGGPWKGKIEHYEASERTANPLWNRHDGAVESSIYSSNAHNVKPKPGKIPA